MSDRTGETAGAAATFGAGAYSVQAIRQVGHHGPSIGVPQRKQVVAGPRRGAIEERVAPRPASGSGGGIDGRGVGAWGAGGGTTVVAAGIGSTAGSASGAMRSGASGAA